MDLKDLVYVVFDTETTGLDAEVDRIIELGAVRIEKGEVTARFSQLINPSKFIPREITQLTGISMGMLVNAPAIDEVLPAFQAFVGDAVLVAHNLSFDEKFLDAECERSGFPDFENPRLCTLRLARRILPRLPSRSLKSLAHHFGIKQRQAHRATDDAETTAKIFLRLLPSLQVEFKVDDLDRLIRFQFKSYADTKGEPKHIQTIRERILPLLPSQPGVYRMYDRHKRLIYVGKAKRLKPRVMSYFRGIEGHPKKTQNLIREVREVKWELAASELDALILESRLIKQHLPKFNRAGVRFKHSPFIRLETSHPYPTICWTYVIRDDEAAYFGPLANREQAEQTVELINRLFKLRECDEGTFRRGQACMYHDIKRCEAPCLSHQAKAAYATEVERVEAFLTGDGRQVLDTITQQMKAAAADLAFEEARWLRDQLRMFERILASRRHIAAPVRAHHSALIHREEDAVLVYLIQFGRLVETIRFSLEGWTKGEATRDHLMQRLQVHFSPDQSAPEKYNKWEIDNIRLLTHWMYCHRGQFVAVPFEGGGLMAFMERVWDTMLDTLG